MKARYNSRLCIPAAIVTLICMAYLDYLLGLEFSLFPLYLIPLAVIAWHEELNATVLVLIVAGLCLSVKAALEHQGVSGYLWYWDTCVKIFLLIVVAYGMWKIRQLLTALRQAHKEVLQINESLEQTVAERTRELAQTFQNLQMESAERLRVQAELREKELMLIQQSRLAAMGEMIGNIAHQWRQPLNRLGLLTQDVLLTYEAGMADATYMQEHVEKAMETIQHMSQTVDDFRNFFKPDKEKIAFSVVMAAKKAVSLLDEALKLHQIKVELLPTGEPYITGYPSEYSQVLVNIIANAKDAFAKRKVESPVITIKAWSEDDKTVVTVTDNAGGIPDEIIKKVFDPYFTTKGADEGTGLGLYMSKTIIEKNMNGSLTVHNVGGGAEFKITV